MKDYMYMYKPFVYFFHKSESYTLITSSDFSDNLVILKPLSSVVQTQNILWLPDNCKMIGFMKYHDINDRVLSKKKTDIAIGSNSIFPTTIKGVIIIPIFVKLIWHMVWKYWKLEVPVSISKDL